MFALVDQIRKVADEFLLEQAESGALLVGYVYGFAPPELLRACGAVPVRLIQSGGYDAQQKGQQIFKSSTCTYCKALVGSEERFPFNALGLIVTDGLCEALRRAGEVCATRLGQNVFTLSVPRVANGPSLQHFCHELRTLQQSVSELTGQPFTEDALQYEIEMGNRVRALLRQINQFRRQEPPSLSASELWSLLSASSLLPPNLMLPLLTKLLDQLKTRPPLENYRGARLMLVGSLLAEDDRVLVELVEENQGHIATDAGTEGLGLFFEDIPVDHDAYKSLARYLLEKSLHILRPHQALFDLVRAEIQSSHIHGILFKTLESCDPWSFQAKRLRTEFPLPFLHIDSDYSPANREQLRTRVQAFLEML